MLSRIILRWNNSAAVGLRNHKMFYKTTQSVSKDAVKNIESSEHPSTDKKNDNDWMITMKSARNSLELLNVISKNVRDFSVEQTLATLKTLVSFQKQKSTSISYGDILRNPDLENLCQSLRRNTEHLNLGDAIEALKFFSYVGVGTKGSKEARAELLKRIKSQLNDATLGNLVFLSFLLRQMESNRLVDSLQMLLPELVQLQVSKNIDHLNVTQLTELLNYISHHRLSEQCTVNILNALILHHQNLNGEQAKTIVWSLSSPILSIPMAYRDALLESSIREFVKNINQFDFGTVLITLAKMINRYLDDTIEYEKFYNEGLYYECTDFVVTNDLGFEKATFLQRRLNRLGFVNIELLEYMLNEMEKNAKLVINCKTTSLITLVTTLSQANYKPKNWNNVRPLILERLSLVNDNRSNLPWVKVSIELLSLGIECPSIWDKVFSNEFLKLDLKRDRRKRLLRILELYQHVKVFTDYNVDKRINMKYLTEAKQELFSIMEHPMQQYLELAFGGPSFVYTKVQTHLGHIIDHVIAFDKQTMEPLSIIDGHDLLYENIAVDKDTTHYIAVITFPSRYYCINKPTLKGIYELRLRAYEQMGIDVVVINHQTWNQLLHDEKVVYLQNEVRLKLKQLQNVLQ
ncbi:uncharacterized protein LOC119073484 [Bradysia coprophila]|uniref:uncharacterized protein LOC119073484 n=1 Tax=Bradysia coprophila TaxID=38358 RepID=UPI00187D8499|nr:uncharacterized protein LOC119073484 [Bradysia coprophila]